MILRIGKNISQFYSYTAYRTDSIWKTPNGKRIWGNAMVRAIRSKNHAQMLNANMVTNDYIYKNYPEGKLSTYAQLGVTSVQIEEDYTGQDWTGLDFAGQHQDPAGLSLSTCHVQFPRTRLPGMVYLGYTDCQRALEVQRLARTDTGSVRHATPLSIPDRRNRTDKHRSRMFLLYHSRPTDSGTHRPYPLLATQGRRHGRRPRLHTENRIKRRQKERQAKKCPKAMHRLRLYGNRLSHTLRKCFFISSDKFVWQDMNQCLIESITICFKQSTFYVLRPKTVRFPNQKHTVS